jgi:hypothetical protein
VIELKRVAIEEEIKSLLKDKKLKRGNNEYLALYPTALNKVIAGLLKKEEKEYSSLAKEWTKETPPRETQIRYVLIYSSKVASEVTTLI